VQFGGGVRAGQRLFQAGEVRLCRASYPDGATEGRATGRSGGGREEGVSVWAAEVGGECWATSVSGRRSSISPNTISGRCGIRAKGTRVSARVQESQVLLGGGVRVGLFLLQAVKG
jgi:hypothetical protein